MPIRRCATTSYWARIWETKGYKAYGDLQNALRNDASPFRQAFYRSHPWGTPDQAIARATELAKAFGTDEIMFIFKYGCMPMTSPKRACGSSRARCCLH